MWKKIKDYIISGLVAVVALLVYFLTRKESRGNDGLRDYSGIKEELGKQGDIIKSEKTNLNNERKKCEQEKNGIEQERESITSEHDLIGRERKIFEKERRINERDSALLRELEKRIQNRTKE